jgi:magnesium transporter
MTEALSNASTETAAQHTIRAVPRARRDQSAGELVDEIGTGDFESVQTVYVVDEQSRFEGILPLAALMRAPRATRVGDLTQPAASVLLDEDQERCAHVALSNDLAAVPVVDRDGRFMGIVPAQALLAILHREHVEDMHRLAGIAREQRFARTSIEDPPTRRMRHRLPWLVVGLAGSAVATWVLAQFERVLEAHLVVVFFIPALVYLADAVGTQTEAVVVRFLATKPSTLRRLLLGELFTGLLIGATLAVIAAPLVWLVYGDFRLALAVGLALACAGTCAAFVGTLLPWTLDRLRVDPAFGSGPLGTIIQDVLTLIIYLTVVVLLLH